MTDFCGMGTTVAQNATNSNWGAGIGINVAQTMGSTLTNGTWPVPLASTGIKYNLTTLPTAGRLVITNGTATDGSDDYCVELTSAGTTIPWTMFNTKCYDTTPDGTALTGAPQMLNSVKFQTGGTMAATTFDFCVTSVTFM
jgi:hypothetical protein